MLFGEGEWVQLRQDLRFSERLASADPLTPYGVEFRYPGDSPPLSKDHGAEALDLAKDVRQIVLEHLKSYLDAGRP